MHSLFLIIKITTKCNLECEYCSEPYRKAHSIISAKTLDNIKRTLISLSPSKLSILLTGGEVFSLNKTKIESIIESLLSLKGYFQELSFFIQTNGVGINDDICSLIKKYDLKIGVSIDLPKEIHDTSRIFPNGESSWEKVTEGLVLLQKYDIPYGILALVSSKMMSDLSEFYNSTKDVNRKYKQIKLIEYASSGSRQEYNGDYVITPKDLADFYSDLFDLWAYDTDEYKFNPFTSIIESLITGKAELCAYSTQACSKIFTVTTDGSIYPCSRFEYFPEMKWGNVNNNEAAYKIKDLLSYKSNRYNILEESSKCGKCKYMPICSGGCPFESYVDSNDFNKSTKYCSTRKSIFTKLSKIIEVDDNDNLFIS